MSVAAKKGLGTGLDVLFGESIKEEKPPEGVSSLPIAKVEPRDNQPRSVFDEEALAELAESIREYGVIQPVTVRQLPSGYYQLIAGERRWRAARLAGLTEIPAQIIEADDRLTTELALVENLQREDLNPVEEAQGYRTLMEEYGLTQDEAAQRVGKSRPAVANALRLLSLAPEVLQFVGAGAALGGPRTRAGAYKAGGAANRRGAAGHKERPLRPPNRGAGEAPHVRRSPRLREASAWTTPPR